MNVQASSDPVSEAAIWRTLLDTYNVTWDCPSVDSSQSMPVGGGDIGLNVWVENGELLMYIGKSDTFDENTQLLKLGRVRLQLTPNPFVEGASFQQTLRLYEGCLVIEAEQPQASVHILIWVEIDRSLIHVEIDSKQPLALIAYYENWRRQDRYYPKHDQALAVVSYSGYPYGYTQYSDKVDYRDHSVQFCHSNRSDKQLFDVLVRQQRLEAISEQMDNPTLNAVWGGRMYGAHLEAMTQTKSGSYCFTDYEAWGLQSKQPATRHALHICLHSGYYTEPAAWEQAITRQITEAQADYSAREVTLEWWAAFWQRSRIAIQPDRPDPSDPAWQIGRNYNLFRYMLACNHEGRYPTKFNGGMFTVDPVHTDERICDTPDFRRWGGGDMTAQNQRLVYWPQLKSGDFAMMRPQFDFYNRSLRNVKLATHTFFGIDGVAFNEYPTLYGIFAGGMYGWDERYPGATANRKRPLDNPLSDDRYGLGSNMYTQYQFNHQLEFSKMILDYASYSGADISEYLDFIESSLTFYLEYYQMQHRQLSGTDHGFDEQGKLVIYPSTALEMYKNVLNPTDVAAALDAVLHSILALPAHYPIQRDKWADMLARLPDLTYGEVEGQVVLGAGADPDTVYADRGKMSEAKNQELPELYPVFPYGQYKLGKPNLDIAIRTWEAAPALYKRHPSWMQGVIFSARMGLIEDAKRLITAKLADGPRRFPAFWGPGFDWVPDHNWGGSGMIGLQEMLVQDDAQGEIAVLPAWPTAWSVDFCLHVFAQTTVSGRTREGRLQQLRIEVAAGSVRRQIILLLADVEHMAVTCKGQRILTEVCMKTKVKRLKFGVEPGCVYELTSTSDCEQRVKGQDQ